MKKTIYILGYILGAFLIILTVVTFVYGCYTSNIFNDTPMNRVNVPGEHLIAFDKPGKYIIYKDYTYDDIYSSNNSYYDDDSYYDNDFAFNIDDLFPNEDNTIDENDSPITSSDISLVNKETNKKVPIYTCNLDNDYNLDYENGEAIFEFYIKDPGAYTFSITSSDKSTDESSNESTDDKYTLTILKNEDAELGDFLLFSAISIVFMVLAVVGITCTSVKILNDKHKEKLSTSPCQDNFSNTYNNFYSDNNNNNNNV